ncbi:hypothetical protein HDV05_003245 [Chytridiales sp. JEL 0842]|nr:hypothetical protein HDV05_003245 [Chytridiales sp. JEL 0842]
MEDIEDLSVLMDDPGAAHNRVSLNTVTIKSYKKRNKKPEDPLAIEADLQVVGDQVATDQQSEFATSEGHFLPGNASVYVKTWGCGHNNSDGEYMAGMLASHGYKILLEDDKKYDADVWVLNSCTVKGPSEQAFINDVKRGKDRGLKVVVAGCVPQGSASKGQEWDGLSVIGVQQIDRVVEVVEESLKGNTVKLTRERKVENTSEASTKSKRKAGGASLDLPKVRRNPFVEIIPINTGCLNQCTYCKTKHARGDLGSYEPEEIWARVEAVIHEGVKEIWLTSEDTGAYGRDIGVTIVDLLWGIVNVFEKYPKTDTMLRVGMTNPPYILEHLPEIVKILSHPRVFSFLHVPIQAASDRVLEDMRRMYTLADFENVVNTLRDGVEGSCTVATDIICGFPTETDDDWKETTRLLEKYQFSVLHISQFYPRPGTPAARMQRLPTELVKQRSREATQIFHSYQPYDSLFGKMLVVLVTEVSADGKHYVGHDKRYRQVLVGMEPEYMGKVLVVEVVRTGKFFVEGSVKRVLEGVGGPGMVDLSVLEKDVAGVAVDLARADKLDSGVEVVRDVGDGQEGSGAKKMMPKLINVNGKTVRIATEGEDESGDGTVLSLSTAQKLEAATAAAEKESSESLAVKQARLVQKWARRNRWGVVGVSLVGLVACLRYGPQRTSWKIAMGVLGVGIGSLSLELFTRK